MAADLSNSGENVLLTETGKYPTVHEKDGVKYGVTAGIVTVYGDNNFNIEIALSDFTINGVAPADEQDCLDQLAIMFPYTYGESGGGSGVSGYSGYSGYSGFSGMSGFSGGAGASGTSGYSGAAGAGAQGINDVLAIGNTSDSKDQFFQDGSAVTKVALLFNHSGIATGGAILLSSTPSVHELYWHSMGMEAYAFSYQQRLRFSNISQANDWEFPNAGGVLTVSASVNGGSPIPTDNNGNVDIPVNEAPYASFASFKLFLVGAAAPNGLGSPENVYNNTGKTFTWTNPSTGRINGTPSAFFTLSKTQVMVSLGVQGNNEVTVQGSFNAGTGDLQILVLDTDGAPYNFAEEINVHIYVFP
jgi:hypothetical protein